MDLAELIRRLWDPVATPVLLAGGVVASQLWQRYLNRMAVLRWTASHARVAVTAADGFGGQIRVLWGDAQMRNVHFAFVEIQNESSRDLSNLEIKLWYTDGTVFLDRGVPNTAQFLPWAPEFSTILNRWAAAPPAERTADDTHYVWTRREVTIPVLNRGGKIGFNFLVDAPSMHAPYVHFACDHLGVRTRQHTERPMFLGVVQAQAAAIGLGVSIAAACVLAASGLNVWVVALISMTIGAFGQVWGAGLIRLKHLISRAIG